MTRFPSCSDFLDQPQFLTHTHDKAVAPFIKALLTGGKVAALQRVTATFRRADGRTLHVRKATRAETPQQAIYDALGVGSAPGGIRKSIV